MQLPMFEVGSITIGGLLDATAEQFGDSPAVRYHERQIYHTYAEFNAICNQVAKGLMALEIEPGEKVAIWANNVPESLYCQFATGKMGAVLVTVNTNYKSFELEYLLKQSDATTLVMIGGVRDDREYIDVVNEVCPELVRCKPGELTSEKLPLLKNVVFVGETTPPGMLPWQAMLDRGNHIADEALAARQQSLLPDDVINMQYYVRNHRLSQRRHAHPYPTSSAMRKAWANVCA